MFSILAGKEVYTSDAALQADADRNDGDFEFRSRMERATFPVHYPVQAPERASPGLTTLGASIFDFRSLPAGPFFSASDISVGMVQTGNIG